MRLCNDFIGRFALGSVLGTVGFIPCYWISDVAVRILHRQDPSSIYSSAPLSAIVQQINRDSTIDQQVTVHSLKIECFLQGVVTSPVKEEIVFRGVLQGLLLDKLPATLFKDKNRIVNTRLSCLMRTVIISKLFADAHQNNNQSSISQIRTFHAFFLGLGLGLIKESRLKLAGAIGAHMANNFISLIPIFTIR
jgi:membrane protease YdiL (CAAX protease family)